MILLSLIGGGVAFYMAKKATDNAIAAVSAAAAQGSPPSANGATDSAGGPAGGEDAWAFAIKRLQHGHALATPEVLFPKLDPDALAELAAIHERGEAL